MSRRSMVFALVAASPLAWFPAVLAQPVSVGPEFQVNAYTTGSQSGAHVAADDAGNYVVVWTSRGSPGSDNAGGFDTSDSIQAQRYDGTGMTLGGQFQVNTITADDQFSPAVAADGAGGFVAVWVSSLSTLSDPSVTSIQGQRYNSAGMPQGGEFQVNSYTTNGQWFPDVAIDGTGGFIVVWRSDGGAGTDASGESIQGQRFDSTGAPVGGQFQVNTYTTGAQDWPRVASDGAGNLIVVWESDAAFSIQGQRYDSSGMPQGPEFEVNDVTSSLGAFPAVATDAAGNFVVSWFGSDAYDRTIQARRFDGSGAALGDQYQVSTTSLYQSGPAIVGGPSLAIDGAGNVVVVWHGPFSAGSDTSGDSVQGQRYDSSGTPVGGEFQVNTYTTGGQHSPSIAADAATNLVVAWQSEGSAGSDTSGISIQAQRFVVLPTTTTTLPTTELLPGRVAIVRPGTLAKFVAKPATGDAFTLPTPASMAAGGSLRIFDTAAGAGDVTYPLPISGWISLGPGGSNGYKYRGAGSIGDPCKVVLVREQVVKGVCRGTGVTLTPPFAGDVGINLTVGASNIFTYCARFGGSEGRNDATLTTRRNAPAPGACP